MHAEWLSRLSVQSQRPLWPSQNLPVAAARTRASNARERAMQRAVMPLIQAISCCLLPHPAVVLHSPSFGSLQAPPVAPAQHSTAGHAALQHATCCPLTLLIPSWPATTAGMERGALS